MADNDVKPRTHERFRRALGNKLLSWDTSDIVDSELAYRKEEWKEQYPDRGECPPDEDILKDIYGDHDLYTMCWEFLMEDLTAKMMERNPKGDWSASVNAEGWMRRDGRKEFHATEGQGLLRHILPKCENTWHMYAYGDDGLAFKISNHDSPTGYWLFVWPEGEESAEAAAIVDEMLT